MFKFLNDEGQLKTTVNKDIDPVVAALELGAGIEELNTEAIRLDILTKAETALERTIDLDNQIAANNLANRGTVSYGIEALEVTAIFLGVDMDMDSVAAGLEDNDQEGAAEKKEGFLAKIKAASKAAFEKIMSIIEKIIDKIKAFFQSKNVEKVSEEIEKSSAEVEKLTGSPNKAPDCSNDNDKVVRIKEDIIRTLGIFGEHIKIESTKDFGELIDLTLDKGIKDYLKSISEMVDEKKVDDIISLANEANNLNVSNKDYNKVVKKLVEDALEIVKKIKLPAAKQHPIIEKIKSEFKDEILRNAGIKGSGVKDEYEYSILFYGHNTTTSNDRTTLSLHFVVAYKNMTAIGNTEKLTEIFKSARSKGNAVGNILNNVNVRNVTVQVNDFRPRKYIDHVKPFSSEELRKLAKAVREFNEQSNDFYIDVKREFGKFRDQAHKAMKKLESITGLQMPTNFKGLALSISGIVSSSARLLPTYLTRLSTDIRRLSLECGAKASSNPFK